MLDAPTFERLEKRQQCIDETEDVVKVPRNTHRSLHSTVEAAVLSYNFTRTVRVDYRLQGLV